MGRLDQLLEVTKTPSLTESDRAAQRHKARTARARELKEMQIRAMRAAEPILGRVIFPARWEPAYYSKADEPTLQANWEGRAVRARVRLHDVILYLAQTPGAAPALNVHLDSPGALVAVEERFRRAEAAKEGA